MMVNLLTTIPIFPTKNKTIEFLIKFRAIKMTLKWIELNKICLNTNKNK